MIGLLLMVGFISLDKTELAVVNAGVQEVYDAVVAADGSVDYPKLHASAELVGKLEAYSAFMGSFDHESIKEPKQKIAILSNTYNVFTLIGVNRAWPVTSVRKIRMAFGFFTKSEWVLGGKKVSLNYIEKKQLRALDPRIHFLINCASGSCPVIQQTVFTADNVDDMMKKATVQFLQDDSKNHFDQKKGLWKLSKIFKWYQGDWGKESDVVSFIRANRPDLKSNPKKIQYLEYDWALNGPVK